MKIIVFDDDPTGSQTVYGCSLILQCDKQTLEKGIKDSSPLLFLLTNTRSLSPDMAEIRLRKICKVLTKVLQENGLSVNDFLFVSRGDSTLRGHGFLEPQILQEELGPFDATFHVPAFFAGGRITVNDIHYVNGVPAHQTIFAEDKIFGYSKSYLPEWLEEKSNSQIKSSMVQSISLSLLNDANNTKKLVNKIDILSDNQHVIVNAKNIQNLNTFVNVIEAFGAKKRFLFRSAASLINSLSGVYSERNSNIDYSLLRLNDQSGKPLPGLIIVGSYLKLADLQLDALLKNNQCVAVGLDVAEIYELMLSKSSSRLTQRLKSYYLEKICDILTRKKTPVIYTSRDELTCSSDSMRIRLGIYLSGFMATLAGSISHQLGYIISKGGITTHNLLSIGLELPSVVLKGQILPGISVVYSNSKDKRKLPIITFPGNLGDQNTLSKVWKMMEDFS